MSLFKHPLWRRLHEIEAAQEDRPDDELLGARWTRTICDMLDTGGEVRESILRYLESLCLRDGITIPLHPNWYWFVGTLRDAIARHGCDHTYRHSEAILRGADKNVEATLDRFRAFGGPCDCTVIANIAMRYGGRGPDPDGGGTPLPLDEVA